MEKKLAQLQQHLYRPIDLMYAAGVLNWDQEIYMPPKGTQARAEQLSTLSAIAHEIFTSEETAKLLVAAETEVAEADYDGDAASLVRVIRRTYDQRTKIPTALVIRESQATSKAFAAWQAARAASDYAKFQPHLQEIVDINIEKAACFGYKDHPYDALLDQFETGMTTAQVEQLFSDLKAGLVPLVQAIAEAEQIDASFLTAQDYDLDRQWDLTMLLLRDMGYAFEAGRQDQAPHPFTINFSSQDVRVTTRFDKNLPHSALFSSLHEGGHALYEQGIPQKFDRTALAGGATLGLHESQSRMWENQVARSIPFWRHYFPIMRAFFPTQLADVNFEQFYRAINKVQPDFIRVEADEVTYNMHIFVRFEMEKDLITGQLNVADVPDAWNAKYEAYLGITPPDAATGCLQDIHWSHGTIGYFPTYTIGNLISAQLYDQAKLDIPNLETGFANADFAPLRNWTRDKVHRHGAKFTAPELLQRELGQKISAQPLLNYMQARYSEIYNL